MNRLEEIIKKYIDEKHQIKKEIATIEAKREQLAKQRNEKKVNMPFSEETRAEINELGRQISQLGCESQELQNKLDSKYLEVKRAISDEIDSMISVAMEEIREIEGNKEGIEARIQQQKDRNLKYEIQKQEFFAKFGRMPDISERAQKENQIKEEECNKNKEQIVQLESQIKRLQEEISELAQNKRKYRNGNFVQLIEKIVEEATELVEEPIELPVVENIIEETEERPEPVEIAEEKETQEELVQVERQEVEVEECTSTEDIKTEEFVPIEDIDVEEFVPVENVDVEEFTPIEEIEVEEFTPIEEIRVEEFEPIQEIEVEEFAPIGEMQIEEFTSIEEVHEEEEIKPENIAEIEETEEVKTENIEQTENIRTSQEYVEKQKELIREVEELEAVIENYVRRKEIAEEFEENEETQQTSTLGQRVTIVDIIAKIKDREVVYVATLNNGEKIIVYPNREEEGKLLENDRENIEEIREILIGYAVAEYRALDKKAIKKVDPVVCEILIRFARKYDYDAQNLIYNYAMTFSRNEELEIDAIPQITYNLYFGEDTKVTKKEKETLLRICRNARKNEKIEIIGYTTALKRIRYIFRRTFNLDTNKALSEGKYL